MKYRILALVLAVLFASCEKETKNDCDTTKVFFYTNAQIVTNCGDFNVDVYIDEEYKGTLQTAYSADETSILCNEKVEDGSLLTVNLKQGKHTYKAIPDCVENRVFYGEFKIEFSECQSVFIDLLNSEHVKTDTKANIFELFTIKIPNGYSYSATYGDDSQIFSMYSNEGDVHFFAEYSPMIQKDTLYEAKAEYVRNFRLPQTDSIIRCQTYPIREIIEQNGSEMGILYYSTNSDLLQNAEGYFFIKNGNAYIELFEVNFSKGKLQDVKQLLSTIKARG